jgi:5'-nucleotidase (lipoprotein e(P4) family)
MARSFIAFLLIMIMTGCNVKTAPAETKTETQDQLLLSVLWFQKSAEMRALYYQCYKNATDALIKNVDSSPKDKPLAVVLDIDETVLDNSPYEGWQILTNSGYSEEMWNKWVAKAEAKALPGAAQFTRFADSLGVAVFYVSNRSANATVPTLKNLTVERFACADSAHLFMKETTSSKVARRDKLKEKYNIILLVGDNLGDFDGVFDKRPVAFGFNDVETQKELFGTKYIVLPNPMYGTWLSEMLKSVEGKSNHEKLLKLVEGMK